MDRYYSEFSEKIDFIGKLQFSEIFRHKNIILLWEKYYCYP